MNFNLSEDQLYAMIGRLYVSFELRGKLLAQQGATIAEIRRDLDLATGVLADIDSARQTTEPDEAEPGEDG